MVDTDQLRALFIKPYGAPGPSEAQWRELYAEDVHFSDPTQEQQQPGQGELATS